MEQLTMLPERAGNVTRRGGTAALVLGALLACVASLQPLPARADNGNTKWVAPPAAQSKSNPVPTTTAALEAGRKIYVRECLSCHGKDGGGDGPKAGDCTKPPGNFTTQDFQSQTDGSIFWKITQGRKPMPAFKNDYSDDQRWQLVDYLRTFRPQSARR